MLTNVYIFTCVPGDVLYLISSYEVLIFVFDPPPTTADPGYCSGVPGSLGKKAVNRLVHYTAHIYGHKYSCTQEHAMAVLQTAICLTVGGSSNGTEHGNSTNTGGRSHALNIGGVR